MFTLRTITPDGLQSNQFLGKRYIYVDRDIQYEEFCRNYKVVFGIKHVADLDKTSDNFSKNCYGIVVTNDGSELTPLYKGNQNYIMSPNGQTFANLTQH